MLLDGTFVLMMKPSFASINTILQLPVAAIRLVSTLMQIDVPVDGAVVHSKTQQSQQT